MKPHLVIFALCLCASTAWGQTMSYWWSQMVKKPDAEQSADYFMLPGTNITFTIVNNHVVISSSGGGGTNSPSVITNIASQFYVLKTGDTMTGQLVITNGNAFGNIVLWADSVSEISFRLTNGYIGNLTYETNGFNMYDYLTVTGGDISTDGIFNGDGSGLTNVTATTSGLTTNVSVVFTATMTTNTLNFTNGLLMAINGTVAPVHCSSLVLPGGGYLIQPNLGTLCLP